MAKGRVAAVAAGQGGHSGSNENGSQFVKTTLFITDVLDANLAYMSLETGKSKAELMRKAVEEYLDRNEYDPSKKPKLSKPAYD